MGILESETIDDCVCVRTGTDEGRPQQAVNCEPGSQSWREQSEREHTGGSESSLANLFDSRSLSIVPSHVCANGAKIRPPSVCQRPSGSHTLAITSTHTSSAVMSAMAEVSNNAQQYPTATHIIPLDLVVHRRAQRPPLDPKLRDAVPDDVQPSTRDHLGPDRPLPQRDEVSPPQPPQQACLGRRSGCHLAISVTRRCCRSDTMS